PRVDIAGDALSGERGRKLADIDVHTTAGPGPRLGQRRSVHREDSQPAHRGQPTELGPGSGLRPIRLAMRPVGIGLPKSVLATERKVYAQQRLTLLLQKAGVGENVAHEVVVVPLVLQYARPHVKGLGGDPQRLRDLLEDLRRRFAQPALDLAQVR